MNNITTIFLSSTGRDFLGYREAVFSALQKLSGFHCIRMEDFVAAEESPLNYCTEQVANCDIFIGILGHYYGNSPPGDGKSFTEYEYEAAVKYKKPRLMFIAPEDFLVPANIRESEENHKKQNMFRSRVLQSKIVSQFKTPDNLALEVTAALFNFTSRGILKIDNVAGKCVVVVEGAKTTEVRIEEISNDGWKLTTNKGDLHLKKVTIIPVSNLKPIVLDFSEGKLPEGSVFNRHTAGYYRPRLGSKLEHAETNTPRFEEIAPDVRALLLEPAATNYLLNSNKPESQGVHNIGPGRYTLWVSGEGSATVKRRGKEIEGAAIENKPFTFTLDSAETVFIGVEGNLFNFQLNGGSLPLSFLPTTMCTLTRAGDNLSISLHRQ